jgi:hypothetical protein
MKHFPRTYVEGLISDRDSVEGSFGRLRASQWRCPSHLCVSYEEVWFRWTKGHVALLGDSAHAMQPNLGQGGCMAIEDGFQLASDLSEAVEKTPNGYPNIESVLKVPPLLQACASGLPLHQQWLNPVLKFCFGLLIPW